MEISWAVQAFKDLSPLQVYDFMRLRSEVFVVEQACIFLDADDKDPECLHLMGYKGHLLVAYTRLVPPGVIYDIPSIGRVITHGSVRRTGAGRALMQESINQVYRHFGQLPIKIGAQLYLKSFYESFGFIQVSDVYLEDGIEHIYMIKDVN
jgi:ElaA protein